MVKDLGEKRLQKEVKTLEVEWGTRGYGTGRWRCLQAVR